MPTKKQEIAVQKLSENIRNPKGKKVTMKKVLKESGYSESVCNSPQRVTKTKGWNELLEEKFPQEKLLKLHEKILNKSEIVSYKGDVIKTGQPHSDSKSALEMVYRLKGQLRNADSFMDSKDYQELQRLREQDSKLTEESMTDLFYSSLELESDPISAYAFARYKKEAWERYKLEHPNDVERIRGIVKGIYLEDSNELDV